MNFFIVAIAYLVCLNPPCQNKISLVKTSKEKGLIEIAVSTSGNFKCTLSIEEGSGPKKIVEKTGRGISTVEFSNVTDQNTYLVEVEFIDESNSRCRSLQLSEIIID